MKPQQILNVTNQTAKLEQGRNLPNLPHCNLSRLHLCDILCSGILNHCRINNNYVDMNKDSLGRFLIVVPVLGTKVVIRIK